MTKKRPLPICNLQQPLSRTEDFKHGFYQFLDRVFMFFVVLLVFILPFIIRQRSLDPFISKRLFWLALMMLAAAAYFLRAAIHGSLRNVSGPLNLPVLAFLGWNLAAYFYGAYRASSGMDLALLLAGAVLYFIVANNLVEDWKLVNLMLVVLGVQFFLSLHGIWQVSGLVGSYWGNVSSSVYGGRAISFFGNPAFYAGYLAFHLPLVLGMVFQLNNRKLRFFAGGVLGLMAVNLILTGSRAGWLGAAVGLICFVLMSRAWSAPLRGRVKITLTALILAVIIAFPFGVKTLGARLSPSSLGYAWSFRSLVWQGGAKMVADKPLLGHGLGSWRSLFPAYRPQTLARNQSQRQYETLHAHNEFLELAAETGVIGLGIFLWLLVAAFRTARRVWRRGGVWRWAAAGLTGGLVAGLVDNSFSVDLRYTASLFSFWLFLGLLTALDFKGRLVEADDGGLGLSNTSRFGLAVAARALLGIGALLIIVWTVKPLANALKAELYISSGRSAAEMKDYSEAADKFSRAAACRPGQPLAGYFLARALVDAGGEANELAAVKEYKRVLSLSPDYLLSHYQLGLLYKKMGKNDQARVHLRRALALDSKLVSQLPEFRRGQALVKEGELAVGMRLLGEVAELCLDCPELMVALGNGYYLAGEPEQALDCYRRGLAVDENQLDLLFNMGYVLVQIGRQQEAALYLERVLVLQPGHEQAKELLGESAHGTRNTEYGND